MTQSIDAICDYENKRQAVSVLTKERTRLTQSCSNYEFDDNTGVRTEICLVTAYNEAQQMSKDNNEFYTYDEVLSEGNAEGIYCDNCLKAYRIKIGPLKDARIAFGNSKRKLSSLGKMFLKGKVKE